MNAANWKFQEMNLIASDYRQESAQQNVHWTLGYGAAFRAFFWLRVFPAPEQSPRPPQRQ
jgi:hypothetical protein